MSWMRTRSGRRVDLFDPDPATIDLGDIAFALSHQNRFNGHAGCYSVAEHSVRVSKVCASDPLAGLLHDAAEAYVGDLIRPLKAHLPGFDAIELRLQAAIGVALKVAPARFLTPAVIEADQVLLATEKRDLMRDAADWGPLPPPLTEEIVPWNNWVRAHRLFVATYRYLIEQEAPAA